MNEPETFSFLRWRFDIAKYRRILANSKPGKFQLIEVPARDLAGQNAFIGVDKGWVATMPEERLQDPLYAVEWGNGVMVIDGHHRIEKALQLNPERKLKVWVMPARMSGMIATDCTGA